MKIKKLSVDGIPSFNAYSVELSYGQLIAIRNALEKDHSEVMGDEIYSELNYWLQNIPGPGEDPEDFKAERDAAKKTKDEAGEETDGEHAPATDTELEAGSKLPPPPSDEEEDLGAPMGTTDDEGGEEGVDAGPKLSDDERDIIDRAMPQGESLMMPHFKCKHCGCTSSKEDNGAWTCSKCHKPMPKGKVGLPAPPNE
jgi:hypothetical protein